jgi:hypothetical protein
VTRVMRSLATVVAATFVMAGACSDGSSVEAFCDQLDDTIAAGPLFPDRTDGEPVPSADALAAIDDLADVAPDEIRGSVEVLVTEANALVADATERDATTTTGDDDDEPVDRSPSETHPPRADVEAAQAAVTAYAAAECGVTLDS